jgi:hypothetical protein
LRIFWCFKHNRSGTFGSTICTNVDVGTDNVASCSEQVLQILPPSLIRKLRIWNLSMIQGKELVTKTHIANIELVSWVVLGPEVIV